ncbi:hypothetical protein PISMIDRAFT_571806 [Pisolithus microcarpus 441]|uniref:Uncharacterized protein n=1 Tax=Pisolithus microcarpus 441 TaxID=765257 RepID=A0A0C9Z415_9AGAM|nr:hypothetical protein PISMIDRAFT_571806 [Pisolithus microcarpus 441]
MRDKRDGPASVQLETELLAPLQRIIMTTWSTRGRLRTSNKYPKLLLWHENGSEYLILSLGCERSYAIETREDEKPPYMHTYCLETWWHTYRDGCHLSMIDILTT